MLHRARWVAAVAIQCLWASVTGPGVGTGTAGAGIAPGWGVLAFWFRQEQMSSPRTYHVAQPFDDECVWFAGGSLTKSPYDVTRSIDIWNTSSRSWVDIDLVKSPELQLPHFRWYAMGGTVRDRYTGGYLNFLASGDETNSSVVQTANVMRYNQSARAWDASDNLSVPRSAASAVTVGRDGRYLLFTGGFLAGPQYIPAIDIWDSQIGGWLPAYNLTLSPGRIYGSVASVWDVALWAGGSGAQVFAIVDLWNSTARAWSAAPPLSIARYGMASASVSVAPVYGLIVFAGGRTGGLPGAWVDIYVFTRSADSTVESPNARSEVRRVTGRPLLQSQAGGTGFAMANRYVFVAGGYDSDSHSLSTVQVLDCGADGFDPATAEWTSAEPLSVSRSDMSTVLLPSAVNGDQYFLSGGHGQAPNPPIVYATVDIIQISCIPGGWYCLRGGNCTELLAARPNSNSTDLGVGGYGCICPFPYAGPHCDVPAYCELRPPCEHGGTCMNTPSAGFACQCAAAWTGADCSVDVNECATNNGGCVASVSTCTNFPGGFNCTLYFVPGSVPTALDSVLPGVTFPFAIAGPNPAFDLRFIPNAAFALAQFPCAVTWGPFDPTQLNQTANCTLADGAVGRDLKLALSIALVVAASIGPIHPPRPIITHGTLRQTPDPVGGTSVLTLFSGAPTKLYFSGRNFAPTAALSQYQTITYGTDSTPLYTCTSAADELSSTTIACVTAAGSIGSLRFTVTTNAGGGTGAQSVTGTDTVVFPITPLVSAVSGCNDGGAGAGGNSTRDCSTEGGQIITVTGINFFDVLNTVVSIGNQFCTSLSLNGSTTLTCTLPIGTGSPLLSVTCRGIQSPTVSLITYALPNVSGLVGCRPVHGSNGLEIAGCDRSNPSPIGIVGSNFGESGVVVLIGGVFAGCAQDKIQPHRRIACQLRPNTLLSQSVLVVQSNAAPSPSAAKVSYAQCTPGTYEDPITLVCTACAPGTFTTGLNEPNCDGCRPGTFTASSNSTNCGDCPPGTFSSNEGSTACSACPINQRQPLSASTQCLPCDADQYWHQIRKVCVECPTGAVCTSTAIAPRGNQFVYINSVSGDLEAVTCQADACGACDSPVTSANATVFTCCGTNQLQMTPLCGSCRAGYTHSGTDCVPCTSPNGGLVFLLLAVLWCYITVYDKLVQSATADSRIFLNFVQYVYILFASQAGSFTDWLNVFSFNPLSLGTGACVAPSSDFGLLATNLWLPVVGFGFLMLNGVVHWAMWRVARRGFPSCLRRFEWFTELKSTESFHSIQLSYQRTTLGFMSSTCIVAPIVTTAAFARLMCVCVRVDPTLCQTVFTYFSCVSVDGQSYMLAYPSINCSADSQYLGWKPFFVALLIVAVCFPLAVLARLYYLNRRGLLFDKSDRIVVYGAWVDPYKPSRYGWEAFVLVRRLVISGVAVAPSLVVDPMSYLAFCFSVFLVLHVFMNPFRLVVDNYTELLAEFVLVVVCIFLIGAPAPVPTSTAAGLTALCFFVGLILLIRIARSRYTELATHVRSNSNRSDRSSIRGVDQSALLAASPPTPKPAGSHDDESDRHIELEAPDM